MYCGPLCLKYCAELAGKVLTLDDAIQICKADPDGTAVVDLIAGLKGLGYRVRARDDIPWKTLTKELRAHPAIVVWWSVLNAGAPSFPDRHWSVALTADTKTITLWDPEPEEQIVIPRRLFETLWYSFDYVDGERVDYIRFVLFLSPGVNRNG